MPGRGGKLPVLAEISAVAPAEARTWALRRADFEALAKVRGEIADKRVVLLSAGEGGPTGALAVAAAASAAGRRTVLVDCDLARPGIAAAVGLDEEPGLHEYLRWAATAPQILQPLALAGPAAAGSEPLTCIAAGQPAAEPATLFDLQSFRHVIAKLRSAYELVVLGGPAPGSDGRSLAALAKQADALVPCIGSAQSSGSGRRRVRAALRQLPLTPLGAIVVGPA
jgi:succinoglycan biosynthesis transport protein ExoP